MYLVAVACAGSALLFRCALVFKWSAAAYGSKRHEYHRNHNDLHLDPWFCLQLFICGPHEATRTFCPL